MDGNNLINNCEIEFPQIFAENIRYSKRYEKYIATLKYNDQFYFNIEPGFSIGDIKIIEIGKTYFIIEFYGLEKKIDLYDQEEG